MNIVCKYCEYCELKAYCVFLTGSWDQSILLHTNDIIQGSCDPLQGGYYYIPAYYHQLSSTHLSTNATEFAPSQKYY